MGLNNVFFFKSEVPVMMSEMKKEGEKYKRELKNKEEFLTLTVSCYTLQLRWGNARLSNTWLLEALITGQDHAPCQTQATPPAVICSNPTLSLCAL